MTYQSPPSACPLYILYIYTLLMAQLSLLSLPFTLAVVLQRQSFKLVYFFHLIKALLKASLEKLHFRLSFKIRHFFATKHTGPGKDSESIQSEVCPACCVSSVS